MKPVNGRMGKTKEKDLVPRKNKKRTHTGTLSKYNYDDILLWEILRDKNGDYKTVIWSALARQVNLKNSKGIRPKMVVR